MAKEMIDLYAVLGVDRKATEKEIKKAYRNLSKVKHPDVCDEPNAKESFQKIVEAYEVLMDPVEKEKYDELFEAWKERKDRGGKTFEEVFEDFHSGLTGAHTPVRGEDIETTVFFTVEEIRKGIEKTITFDRFINCGTCEGHGFRRFDANVCIACKGKGFTLHQTNSPFGDIKSENRCSNCNGRGYTNIHNCETCSGKGKRNVIIELMFPLPEETTDGYTYVMRRRGDDGLNGAQPGDLIVHLKQAKQDEYTISNTYDLHKTIQVPYVKTLTGGTMPVSVPRGKTIDVEIPQMACKGSQIVLPDEGLLNKKNGFYGTLTLHVDVEMPKDLSNSQVKQLIEILG